MKNIFLYLLYGYLGLFVAPSFAQTNDFLLNGGPATITYPIMGSVIQRNSSDNANVSFCGNVGYSYQQTNLYNYVLGLTELDPMTGAVKLINGSPRIITYNFNAASDIVSISSELGAFNKYINVPKGWWNAGFQIQRKDGTGGFVACTIKFGVGDTFIIAGQSNARGFPEVFDNGIVGYDTNLSNAQLPDAVRVIGNAERPANAPLYGADTPNEAQTLKLGGFSFHQCLP